MLLEALTPPIGPIGDNMANLDTEARRKRARHNRSGGAIPRTLGFEGATEGPSSSGQDTAAAAADPATSRDGGAPSADEERGRRCGALEEAEAGDEGGQGVTSSSSCSESEEGGSAAGSAAAAKALARVMRLQSEHLRLQHAIQVTMSCCPFWNTVLMCC